jgi:hypothetical protein
MNHRTVSNLFGLARACVVSLSALFAASAMATTGVWVQNSNYEWDFLEIDVKPSAPSFSVSVATPPKTNFAAFEVKITNPTNKPVYNIFVFGRGIAQSPESPASFFAAGSPGCSLGYWAPWLIKCNAGNLAPWESKTITVTFLSPTAPSTELNLKWAVSSLFPPSYEHGEEPVALITETPEQQALGFTTAVPVTTTPQTFWTGVNTSGGGVGCVATFADPFCTTITLPPVLASKSATVAEGLNLESCSPVYGQCFESELKIPAATFSVANPLVVYLRVDVSRIKAGASIANATVSYEHTPGAGFVPLSNCSVAPPAPQVPCIAARKKYGSTSPADWKGDWEFTLNALENGRYRN